MFHHFWAVFFFLAEWDFRLENLRFANDGVVVLGEVARVLCSNDLDHFLKRKDMMLREFAHYTFFFFIQETIKQFKYCMSKK